MHIKRKRFSNRLIITSRTTSRTTRGEKRLLAQKNKHEDLPVKGKGEGGRGFGVTFSGFDGGGRNVRQQCAAIQS
jgi:hypothetical protein